MATLASSSSSFTLRRLAIGFAAGVLSLLFFHQVVIAILWLLGVFPGHPYSFNPVGMFGVPFLINAAFWSGLWGVAYVFVADRLPRPHPWLSGAVFGLLGPLVVNWFIVAPLKGLPIAQGFDPARMWPGLLILSAFGIGIALFDDLLKKRL